MMMSNWPPRRSRGLEGKGLRHGTCKYLAGGSDRGAPRSLQKRLGDAAVGRGPVRRLDRLLRGRGDRLGVTDGGWCRRGARGVRLRRAPSGVGPLVRVHEHPAQHRTRARALRRLQGDHGRPRSALGEPLLHQEEGLPARPHPQRGAPQGQRPPRQPDRDRERHGVARRGLGPRGVRRRRLRVVRGRSERDGTAPRRKPLRLRPHGRGRRGVDRDHAAREHSRGQRGPQARARRTPLGRGRGGRRRAPHAPRLRPRDRTGHAAPPAGGGRHRGAQQDRPRRGRHGGDGAVRAQREARGRPRRGAQGRHGLQPARRAGPWRSASSSPCASTPRCGRRYAGGRRTTSAA